MGESIVSGASNGPFPMKVNKNNQAHVFAVVESEKNAATTAGKHFNLNTGVIPLTGGTAENAIFYLKNNNSSFVIDKIIFYVGTRAGTITDDPLWTVIKNPTGGDIITGAVEVSVRSNARFSVKKDLKADIFKGREGATITGGIDHGYFGGTSRIEFFEADIELDEGDTIGIKLATNADGACNVYVAVDGHTKDLELA